MKWLIGFVVLEFLLVALWVFYRDAQFRRRQRRLRNRIRLVETESADFLNPVEKPMPPVQKQSSAHGI